MEPSADGLRLPTEAEWEYACRAGTTSAFSSGAIAEIGDGPVDPNLDEVGWYAGNSQSTAMVVAGKQANTFGLVDMHGNASEWCLDWYGSYPTEPVSDPIGVEKGELRVVRGGDTGSTAAECRSANRAAALPGKTTTLAGFRPVLKALGAD